MNRIASLALVFALALSLAAPVSAADKTTADKMKLVEYSGTVEVKNSSGKARDVHEGLQLYNGCTVSTGKSSSAYIDLDGTAAVKLDRCTKAELRKAGKQLEIHLLSGQLFFETSVPRKADQSYTISTANTVTGVRGSFGWQNMFGMGLVHGHAEMTCTNPQTGAVTRMDLRSGEGAFTAPGATGGAAGAPARTTLTNDMVPAGMAEMILADESKREQAQEAGLDVQTLSDTLEQKKADENAAEQRQAQESEAAAQQQARQIAASTTATPDDARLPGVAEAAPAASVEPAAPTDNSEKEHGENGGSDPAPVPDQPTTCTVTFDANGGVFPDGTRTKEQKAASGTKLLDLISGAAVAQPTREGYEFVGWYLNRESGSKPDNSTTVTGSVTIYAGWAEETPTHLDLDAAPATTQELSGLLAKNKNVSIPASGNTYEGLTIESDQTLTVKADANAATGAAGSTVTFVKLENKGAFIIDEGVTVFISGGSGNSRSVNNGTIKNSGSIRRSNGSLVNTVGSVYVPSDNRDGNDVQFIITLDLNGGSFAYDGDAVRSTEIAVDYNAEYYPDPELDYPILEGNEFDGWYTQAGDLVNEESPILCSSCQTLTARWVSFSGDSYDTSITIELPDDMNIGTLIVYSGNETIQPADGNIYYFSWETEPRLSVQIQSTTISGATAILKGATGQSSEYSFSGGNGIFTLSFSDTASTGPSFPGAGEYTLTIVPVTP